MLMRPRNSVTVVGLNGPAANADEAGLIGRQLGQMHADFLQVEAGDLLVEVLSNV